VRCIAEPAAAAQDRPLDLVARSSTSLRGFRVSDVPYIVPIVADALREHYDPALYPSLSATWPDGFLVATDPSDVPIGFLLGVHQVEGEGRVLMFAVDREHRGRGLGTVLMNAFLAECRTKHLRRITLEVRVSNATAIRFYTRYRFSVVDMLRGYYSDGENGYQMARDVG
jgi:ribosomal-protein-alanine N-acetyltransferase